MLRRGRWQSHEWVRGGGGGRHRGGVEVETVETRHTRWDVHACKKVTLSCKALVGRKSVRGAERAWGRRAWGRPGNEGERCVELHVSLGLWSCRAGRLDTAASGPADDRTGGLLLKNYFSCTRQHQLPGHRLRYGGRLTLPQSIVDRRIDQLIMG